MLANNGSLSRHRTPSSKASQAKDNRARGDVREFADRMLEPGMRDKEQKRRKFPKRMVGGGVLKGLAGEGWSGRQKKTGWCTTGAGQRARVAAAH